MALDLVQHVQNEWGRFYDFHFEDGWDNPWSIEVARLLRLYEDIFVAAVAIATMQGFDDKFGDVVGHTWKYIGSYDLDPQLARAARLSALSIVLMTTERSYVMDGVLSAISSMDDAASLPALSQFIERTAEGWLHDLAEQILDDIESERYK